MRILTIVILCLSTLALPAKAAGPVMHVMLGERWLAKYAPNYTAEEKRIFLLGTVFPDIRYLGVIDKNKTHFKSVTLQNVYQGNSPFKRGMLFHSYVDDFRNKIVLQSGLNKNLQAIPSRYRGTFLKLVEDQILHEQAPREAFIQTLSEIPEDEKQFNIPPKSLMQWHTGLTLYFSTLPSTILMQLGLFDKPILSLDASTVKTWGILLPEYVQQDVFRNHVKKTLSSFDRAFETYKPK